ncbi:Uncharacterised protein [Mycobacteroides abscessus subsp. massiliense]|nr:hypothetical protein [Mycobacteroides abscessus]SKF35834.1 Uncharacterised protein [Mycobacteroides abscessus subsp. massiliense]SKF43713.1 Uncharacterised protein [Mycobacteroides abscessus subsp. massiliense]SKF45552.1 Uncharacterised protein [Mycobacteroides abscessus subsp. massiliense]SKF48361.1 Uncharacterised protein [Mycobacteroides abscessus subsp. massiliense]SKF50079.1 Uncharacterised protein [Mycobacteroides abscessus subsp. massiliense]
MPKCDESSGRRDCGCPASVGGPPHITWSHQAEGAMECPDEGQVFDDRCIHHIDLTGIRQRAQDYIESLGAGNWGRDDDTWIDMLRPAAGTQDALLMGRFAFAVSPDAMLAILDTLEALHRGQPEQSSERKSA